MRNRLVAAVAFSILCWGIGCTADAQDSERRASWDCLPETTAVALRIPHGQAILDEFKQTKFGSVILSQKRSEQVQRMLSDHEEWAEWVKKLQEYGLSPDDLIRCLTGETGGALVVETLDDSPFWIGLGWFEPGDERAARLRDAIATIIENQEDEDPPIRRRDIEIEEQDVMLLTLPSVDEVYAADAFDFPGNLGDLSPEERREAMRAASRAAEENKETKVLYSHLLLAARDGRMLVAATLDGVEEPEPRDRIELLSATFAGFIAAHTGEPGTFASRIEAAPGVGDVLPQGGQVFWEIYGDIRPLVRLIRRYAEESEFDAEELIGSLGIDQLGVAAIRTSLDRALMTTGVFVEAASPRRGMMTALEQPELDPEPAAWVPASVLEYGHLSLDLGKLYRQIKAIVLASAGEVAEMGFQQVEATVKQAANADVATVLSSLGHRHTVLSFEPRMRQGETPDGEPTSVLTERAGMVWKITDEELWKRLMQTAQAYAALAGDNLKYEKVQGFEGYRLNSDDMEGGLFLGKGYLVLGMGEEVVDQLLALVNNPPAGKEALRNSDAFRRATNLLQLESGQSMNFTDDQRYAGFVGQMFEPLLDQPELLGMLFAQQGADAETAETLAEQIRKLMPTDDELRNMFGVSIGYRRVTDRGLEIKSVSELPR